MDQLLLCHLKVKSLISPTDFVVGETAAYKGTQSTDLVSTEKKLLTFQGPEEVNLDSHGPR